MCASKRDEFKRCGTCGEMKQSGWPRLLSREEAAVPVAVHEAKNGRNAVFSRPLQAPERLVPTTEYSILGNVLKYKLRRSRSPLLSSSALGNVLKFLFRALQAPERLVSTAEHSPAGKRTQKSALGLVDRAECQVRRVC
jgi:hypothetical protein